MGSLTLPRSMVVGPRDVDPATEHVEVGPASDRGHVTDATVDHHPRDALASRGTTQQLADDREVPAATGSDHDHVARRRRSDRVVHCAIVARLAPGCDRAADEARPVAELSQRADGRIGVPFALQVVRGHCARDAPPAIDQLVRQPWFGGMSQIGRHRRYFSSAR